jgi:hypothetical protein
MEAEVITVKSCCLPGLSNILGLFCLYIGTCMREEGARGARGPGLRDQIVINGQAWELGFVSDLLGFVKCVKFVVS